MMNATYILKGIRGKRLRTQDDLASQIGVSRQMYNIYENNLLNCELNIVFKILNAIGATEEEISDFFNALKQDYMSCKHKNRRSKYGTNPQQG